MSDAASSGIPDARAATAAYAAAGKPSRARRIAHVLAAVLVFVVLPMALVGALVGEFGAGAMAVGLVLGVAGSKIGGTRRMAYLAPAIGVAGGLGAFTAYDWGWVALLATVGVIAGAGIRFGWLPALLMVPYAATFVRPVSTGTDAVIYGAIVAIATGYGIILARRFGAPDVIEGDRQPVAVAAVVASVFGIVLGASAAIGVALGWTEPYWVPEPVLILVLYVLLGKREKIRGKAIGTALGVVAAIPVAILSPPAGVRAAVGTVAFVLALTQAKRYWLMYGLYTFSLVLVLSAPGHVGYEAEERGVQILVGIGILVVGLAVVTVLAGWLRKRYPQPELAPGGPS
jgi:Fusaric acid resistance protein-like